MTVPTSPVNKRLNDDRPQVRRFGVGAVRMARDDRAGRWFDLVGAEMTDIRERLREARRMPFREKHRCLFTQAANEIERLRKGIQDYLDGNYISPRDRRVVGPKEKCPHGMFYWDACGSCIDEHFAAVLSPSHQVPIETTKERQL